MSNEDILREGECPHPGCIEPAGHSGPHSGEMAQCNECRFYAGANFCAHCGRPTERGKARVAPCPICGGKEPLAVFNWLLQRDESGDWCLEWVRPGDEFEGDEEILVRVIVLLRKEE